MHLRVANGDLLGPKEEAEFLRMVAAKKKAMKKGASQKYYPSEIRVNATNQYLARLQQK
jgi:hypothetical protein